MEKYKILIDTDLGDDVDDAAAIMLALGCPELEILGVTTVYKDTGRRKEMVEDLLRHWGRTDIPVHKGRGRALLEAVSGETEQPIQYGLVGERDKTSDAGVSAENGDASVDGHAVSGGSRKGMETAPGKEMGLLAAELPETAVDFILDAVRREPELVILELGCMTNLAQAFLREPELMKKVRIIAMGGAFFSTSPEWNIVCDPEAASIVLEQSENLVMMGLDVTKYLKVSTDRVEEWKSRKSETMDYYLRGVDIFQKRTGYPITLHDVLLPAYLIDPKVVTLKRGHYSVELMGRLTRGTMVDRSNYYEIDPTVERNFWFAEKLDLERFWGVMDRYF